MGHGIEGGYFDPSVDVLAEWKAIVSGKVEPWNSSDSRIWRKLITSRLEFGTSIPTVGFPRESVR